jgi:hypothetical protein
MAKKKAKSKSKSAVAPATPAEWEIQVDEYLASAVQLEKSNRRAARVLRERARVLALKHGVRL